MAETPERCPTCGTQVPEGASRCPACGRIFGEENRCPHCHAVAAVIRRGRITVCAACGKPRTGTVVIGGEKSGAIVPASQPGREASTRAMLTRARGRGQRALGVLALATGVLMATLAAAVLPGSFGLVFAIAIALLGAGAGALSLRAGARAMRAAEEAENRAREAAVLELAAERGGALTATEVAKALGVSVDDADAMLTGMVGDGTHVSVDVDEEGVVRFVFRELVGAKAPVRVRVEPSEAPGDELAPEASGSERARAAKERSQRSS